MTRTITIAAALAALPSACGGEGDGGAQSGGAASPAESPGFAADCVETTEVEAQDNTFEPVCLIIAPGDSVTVTNTGGSRHSFTIRGTDIDHDIEPGDQVTVEGVGDVVDAGVEQEFFCKYHGSMVGYLNVA